MATLGTGPPENIPLFRWASPPSANSMWKDRSDFTGCLQKDAEKKKEDSIRTPLLSSFLFSITSFASRACKAAAAAATTMWLHRGYSPACFYGREWRSRTCSQTLGPAVPVVVANNAAALTRRRCRPRSADGYTTARGYSTTASRIAAFARRVPMRATVTFTKNKKITKYRTRNKNV